jgi:hypothetical protein
MSFVTALAGIGITGLAGTIGGGMLTGAAIGAGGAALTGGDVGEGALFGGITGGIGSGVGAGLSAAGNAATAANTVNASTVGSGITAGPISGVDKAFAGISSPAAQMQAVASPLNVSQATMPSIGGATVANASPTVNNLGLLGEAGQAWNNLSPMGQTIGKGVIGLGATSMLDSAMASDPTIPEQQKMKNRYAYNKQFNYAPQYAAGGITDLDTYMSNAQNIPNPREVADPEGYGGSSMQMLAGGGISKLIPGGEGMADSLVSSSLPGMIFGWEHASDLPIIGELFNRPEDIATLTPDEKKKLMAMAGNQPGQVAAPQQMAQGGIADLGGYATGGRPNLLNGVGDGVSDSIPASIAGKQPARLAAGEYVVPARIVSELGNGSTDAGAQRLDEMVKKIQAGRSKSMGSKKQFANDTKAYKHLPV